MKFSKFICLLTILFISASCSSNSNEYAKGISYDSEKCDSYIHKYSADYNSNFNHDAESYDASLRSISQDEFIDMIKQLNAIIFEYKNRAENINKLESIAEQKNAVVELQKSTIYSQYNALFKILSDARARALVSKDNIKQMDDLSEESYEAFMLTLKILGKQ
jgi:hypothetical protein